MCQELDRKKLKRVLIILIMAEMAVILTCILITDEAVTTGM